MDENFWPEALRDLCLLLAGGLLTLLGGWISNLYSARRDRATRDQVLADNGAARERAAIESAREALMSLYVEARRQSAAGEEHRVEFDSAAILDAESRSYLIRDRQLRELVGGVLGALRGLGLAIEVGLLVGAPVQTQIQVLYSAIQLLSASLRGDELPANHVGVAQRIGEATATAWESAIRAGRAEGANG